MKPLAPLAALLLALALSTACDRSPEPKPTAPAAPKPALAKVTLSDRSSRPAAARVVAVGDLHGDLEMARRVFRKVGAIDDKDNWVGGALVLVQTGDAVDRGDDDRKILDLIEKLRPQAKAAGGELIAMAGNHELMNATHDFRYVTPGALSAFADLDPHTGKPDDVEPSARGRAIAFSPGGAYALKLADHPVIVRVGDTVFAHGGVLPKHVTAGVDALNDGTRDWLLGKAPHPPEGVLADDGPVWTRLYSDGSPSDAACEKLGMALEALSAKRLVMGHTVQKAGINSVCDGKGWRIDVGLAHLYGGPVQALEIRGGLVEVLKE
jgi:hypothetical protein